MIQWLSMVLMGLATATAGGGDRAILELDFEEAQPRPGERLIDFPDLLYRPAGPLTPGAPGQWGVMRLSSTRAHQGEWAFEASPNGLSMHARSHTGTLPVLPATTYEVAAWISTKNLGGDGASIALWCEDEHGHYVDNTRSTTQSVSGTAAWTRVTATITTPTASALSLALEFQVLPTAGKEGRGIGALIGGTAWFDDVAITVRPALSIAGPADSIADAGTPVSFLATTIDPLPGPRSLVLTLQDDRGETTVITAECDASPTTTPIDLGVLRCGWYAATVAFWDDTKVLEEVDATFLVANPGKRGATLRDEGQSVTTLQRRGAVSVIVPWQPSPTLSDAAALARRAQECWARGITPIVEIEPTQEWSGDLTRLASYLGGITCRFRLLGGTGSDHEAAQAILSPLLPSCTIESPSGSGEWNAISLAQDWKTLANSGESIILECNGTTADEITQWSCAAAIWRHAGGKDAEIQTSDDVSPLHGILRTIVSSTTHAAPAGTLQLGDDIECHLYHCDDGTYTAVMWTPSGTPRRVTLPTPTTPQIIDAMGNSLPVTSGNGGITVDVSPRPIIITGLDGPTMAFCRDLRFATATLPAQKTTHHLDLEITNHFDAPITLHARPHDGDGYTISPRPLTETVARSATLSRELMMRVISPAQAGRRWVPIEITLQGGTHQHFTWMVPIEITLRGIDVSWTWHFRRHDVIIDLTISNQRPDDIQLDVRVDADSMARQPVINLALPGGGVDHRRIVVRHGASALAGDTIRLIATAKDGTGQIAGLITIPAVPAFLAGIDDSQ